MTIRTLPILALAPLLLAMAPEQEAGPAAASIAPYRYDDLLWENGLVAYRIYGEALEAAEPPSGSGIDAWGKRTTEPFMARTLRATGVNYHDDHGDGLDFYSVGTSRGAGGLGIWHDNKLWVSRNYRDAEILSAGPEAAVFRVRYAPWPVDVVRQVSETRDFTLPAGSRYTRMSSTIDATGEGPLTVAIGIARRPAGTAEAAVTTDAQAGMMAVWGPDTEHGAMGIVVRADPARIVGFTKDAENFLMLLEIVPGEAFDWCMASGWSGTGDFTSAADWQGFALAPLPDHCTTTE